ncbi:glycosyltransferase [Thermodesulfobacteriota bacterium]
MDKLIVWLFQTGEQLPIEKNIRKMRNSLIAKKLVERGHTVCWWASCFEHQRKIMLSESDKEIHVSPNFTIRLLKGFGYKKNVSISRYIDHYLVSRKFRIYSRNLSKPDVIIASTPCYHLAYEAACYAEKMGIPLLVDIQDVWPDIFLDRIVNPVLKRLGRLVLAADFAKVVSLLRKADGLIAMSNGILKWGLNKIGREHNKWDRAFFLGYKSPYRLPKIESRTTVPDWLKGREKQKLFIFLGTFGISYELDLVVQAADRFHKSGETGICFVLAGRGEKYESIRKQVKALPNVVLPGWIGDDEIRNLLQSGWTGLVCCKSVLDAMPNKCFEYLSADLPLISSLEGEMAELIDHYKIGMNYLPGDLEGLCQCIEYLTNDPVRHDEMAKNAYEFFKNFGDADKIYDEYAKHIERLVQYKNSA